MDDLNSAESEIVDELDLALDRALDERFPNIDEICGQFSNKFSNSIIFEKLLDIESEKLIAGQNVPQYQTVEAFQNYETTEDGRYLILKLLNNANFASTRNYQAMDTHTGKFVVIKQLVRTSNSQVERDASALKDLNHRNIRKIVDIDIKNTPPQYLVTEYVDGQSLRQSIAEAPFDLPRVVDTGIAIVEALRAVHSHDLYHRDLKPDNVLFDRDCHVTLIDFGLAKYASESDNKPAGTLVYRAPEQFVGDDCKRTDIFGFGTILYELLLGARFWEGPSLYQLEFDLPDEYRDRWSMVPEILRSVLKKCLQFSRKKRYQTARALLSDLKKCKREIGEGNKDLILQTGLKASHNFNESTQRSIGVILCTVSQLLAEISDIGLLGLRAFCHVRGENETLIPLVAYAGHRQEDVNKVIQYNDPPGYWKIGKSFTDNEYVCEDLEGLPNEEESTQFVWDQLHCVAAHPIRLVESINLEPLGTVSFDSSQGVERLNWEHNRLVQRTIANCAEAIYYILKNDTAGKS